MFAWKMNLFLSVSELTLNKRREVTNGGRRNGERNRPEPLGSISRKKVGRVS